jgi:hypothetical protein
MADKLVLKGPAKSIWLNGYDISAESNRINLESAIEEQPSDNFANGAKETEPGMEMVKGTVAVMLPITFAWEKALFDARGTGVVLAFCFEGNSAGQLAYAVYGLSTKHYPGAQVGQLLGTTVELASKGTPMLRGKVLEAVTQRSASGNSGSLQLVGGVPSGQSLWIAYQVREMTATNLAAVLQRDDNAGFSSPLTAITLSTFTAVGGEVKSVAGPITDDYYRLAFTLTGVGNYQVAAILAVQ